MSPPRAKSEVKRYGRQPLLDPLKTQGKTATIHSKPQPRGIKRKRSITPVRRSARLQKIIRLHQQPEIQERLLQLPSPISITLDKEVRFPALIQLRPLTPAEASAQSISLDQTFPSRSKAKAK